MDVFVVAWTYERARHWAIEKGIPRECLRYVRSPEYLKSLGGGGITIHVLPCWTKLPDRIWDELSITLNRLDELGRIHVIREKE